MALVDNLLMAGQDNKKTLESMDKTLRGMLASDKKQSQADKAASRKASQTALRASGDRQKAEKKDNSDVIKELHDIKKILKEQRKPKSSGSNGIADGIASKLANGIGNALKSVLGSAAFWKGLGIGAAILAAIKGAKSLNNTLGNARGRSGKTSKGTTFDLVDVESIADKRAKDQLNAGGGAYMTEAAKQERAEFIKLRDAMSQGKGQKDRIERQQKRRDELFKARDKINRENDQLIKDGKNPEIVKINSKQQLNATNAEITKLNESLGKLHSNDIQNKAKIRMLADSLLDERELVQLQIKQGRRVTIPEHLKGKIDNANLIDQATSGFGTALAYEKDKEERNAKGYQRGGPITVPGSGSGDKVPMMLQPGSFVLNRNASKFLKRQKGGDVPTILEPGELVFPKTTPGLKKLNSSIPRFQTGGEVNHPDTGSGFQPGNATDQQGRPVVLSQGAAEAFKKMMDAGGVKGSDVASSKRSRAKNDSIPNSAKNSAHLYGEAIDIHGASKAWMIDNSDSYGWKRNNYMADSWHWDYKGGDSKPINEKNDDKSENKKTEKKAFSWQGLLSGAVGALGSIFGGGLSTLIASSGVADLAASKYGFKMSNLTESGPLKGANLGALGSILTGLSSIDGSGSGGNDSGTTSSVGATVSEEKLAKNLINDMGVTKDQAAGIVGNLSYESAGLKPDIREGMTFGNSWEKGRSVVPAGYG